MFSIWGVLHLGGLYSRGVFSIPGGFSIWGVLHLGEALHPGGVLHPGGFSIQGVGGSPFRGGFSIQGGFSILGGLPCDLSHHAFDVTCMLPPHQLRPTNSAAAYIVLVGHVTCKASWDTTPPHVNRIKRTCKNITSPATSFAGGKY